MKGLPMSNITYNTAIANAVISQFTHGVMCNDANTINTGSAFIRDVFLDMGYDYSIDTMATIKTVLTCDMFHVVNSMTKTGSTYTSIRRIVQDVVENLVFDFFRKCDVEVIRS